MLEHNQKPLSTAGAVRSTNGVLHGAGAARHCFSIENDGDAGAGVVSVGATKVTGAAGAGVCGGRVGGVGCCVGAAMVPVFREVAGVPPTPATAAPAIPVAPIPVAPVAPVAPSPVPAPVPPPGAPPPVAFAAGTHVPSTQDPYEFAFGAAFPAPLPFQFPCPWTHFPAVWSQCEFLYQASQLPLECLPFLLCPFPQLPPPCPVEESSCIMNCICFMAFGFCHAIVRYVR